MDPLRVVKGAGTFNWISEPEGSEPFTAPFTISFFPDGSAIAEPNFNAISNRVWKFIFEHHSNRRFNKLSLSGLSEDGATIRIDEIVPSISLSFSVISTIHIVYLGEISGKCEAHFGLTNLVFTGCQYEESYDDDHALFNSIPLSLNPRDMELRRVQDYKKMCREMEATRKSRVTSEIVCIFPYGELEQLDEVVDNIACLCSLAATEEVVPIYRDIYFQGKVVLSELRTQYKVPYTGGTQTLPMVLPNPCFLKAFLEAGYPRVAAFQETLSLRGLCYLFVKSQHPELSLEVRFITMVMALESFCSYSEQILENTERFVPLKSVERAKRAIQKILNRMDIHLDEAVIVEMAERTASPHPDFRDKLRYALQEFSIEFNENDLKSIRARNTIVHTGQFPADCDPTEEYYTVSNLLLRIILTILEYRGDYLKRGLDFSIAVLPRTT